jgi:hypothetical protein
MDYFVRSFRGADTGGDGAVVVFRDDATMLARLPLDERTVGKRLPNSVLFEELSRSDAGTYETVSPTDGTRRIISYRRSTDLPIITLVAFSKGEVVRNQFVPGAIRDVTFASVIMALLLGLASLLVRQVERRGERGSRRATPDRAVQNHYREHRPGHHDGGRAGPRPRVQPASGSAPRLAPPTSLPEGGRSRTWCAISSP